MRDYFIFAGEISGDLHGSLLIKALQAQSPTSTVWGIGGPAMRTLGMECILNMEDFQVMGFTDVLSSFPKLFKHFYLVRDAILKRNPACVILIDYPGFNLRLAKSLRKKGFSGKIVQYICPSVWAHGKKRIKTLADTLDLLLTVFPFEKQYFSRTPLKVRYIGNPLVEKIENYSYDEKWKQKVGLSVSQPILALFPGSRLGEIKRNLPLLLSIAARLQEKDPSLQIALSCSQEEFITPIQKQLVRKCTFIPRQFSYELMRDSQTALAKSGTVTLELALHQRPTMTIYQLSLINYLVAKYVLRLNLPFYGIVNILAGREVFPEFIGRNISISHCHKKAESLHFDAGIRHSIQTTCHEIIEQLKMENSSEQAIQAIQELFA